MKLNVETRVTEAHHPRANGYSIANPDARYKIVYNIYTAPEPRAIKHDVNDSGRKINLVFVHGAQLGKDSWLYLFEMLFEQLHDILGVIVSMDTINTGDSYKLNKDILTAIYDWHDGGKDIIRVVKDAGLDKPGAGRQKQQTILVGHSMGGAQIHHAAYHESDLIDSLIGVDPIIYTPKEIMNSDVFLNYYKNLLTSLKQGIVDEWDNEEQMLKYTRTRGVSRKFHPRCLQDYIKDTMEPITDPKAKVRHKTPAIYQFVPYLSSLGSFQNSPNIASLLDCEVLQIIGEHADWQTREQIDGYYKLLKYPQRVVIKDGGHLVPFQQPEETTKAIVAFVRHRYASYKPERAQDTYQQVEQILRELNQGKLYRYSKL